MHPQSSRLLALALASRLYFILLALLTNHVLHPFDKSSIHPFANWDGIHFTTIAKLRRYPWEQFFAFFPAFPILSALLVHVFPGMSEVLAGMLVSNMSHILATFALYRLTLHVMNDRELAWRSCVAYNFTPASMNLSATYTESLFNAVSFLGMYYFEISNDLGASLCWAIAASTRANGIVLLGFPGWAWLRKTYLRKALPIMASIKTAVYVLIVAAPFVAFQWYAHSRLCPGRPWCDKTLPLVYTFVQAEYWNVGFLKYYTLQQIPNFLLAAPFIAVSLTGIRDLVRHKKTFPYAVYWAFNLVLLVTTMHVQVAIRFFTSMPGLHWTMAKYPLAIKVGFIYASVGTALFALFYPPA